MNTILDVKIANDQIYRLSLDSNKSIQQQIRQFCSRQNLEHYEEKILNAFTNLFNQSFLQRMDKQRTKSKEKFEKMKQDKISKEQEECTFKPKIQKSSVKMQLTPIKNRKHQLCKQENKSMSSFSPKINNNYSIAVSPFKDRMNQKQICHQEHWERHQKEEKPKKKKTVIIRLESGNESVEYEHQKERVQLKGVFKRGVEEQEDLRRVYEEILEKNQRVDEEEYKILKQLFRELVCISSNRYRLEIRSIDYSLVDKLHIEILERFVEFYGLNLSLALSQDEFIALMMHSRVLHSSAAEQEGKEKAEGSGGAVPKHYQKYLERSSD